MINRKGKVPGDRVLVKLKPTEKVSAGGIVFIDNTVEKNQYATQEAYVMQIGSTAWKDYGDGQPWAKIGQLVKVLRYSGEDDTTIEEGSVYRVINDVDIVYVWENEDYEDKELLRHFND
jgi:co-chaperonin GroES (HSP10)